MHRTPPPEVRRILRKEVGFGCPVKGCGEVFLTWHHFDPPWHVEQHHRSEGMIAVCRPHHDAADAGVFSAEELRQLKRSGGHAAQARGEVPWAKKQWLIRLGGCYSGGTKVPLMVGGKTVIELNRNGDGLLLLSFTLEDNDGTVIAEMEDNIFTIVDPTLVNDVEALANRTSLRFWLGKRDVGLDLSFRRLTLDELEQQLASDRNECRKQLPPDIDLGDMDVVRTHVVEWAVDNCLDDERRVPFLNFERLVIYSGTRRIDIKNGVGNNRYCAELNARTAGFSL